MKRKIRRLGAGGDSQVGPRDQPRGARPLQPRGARLPHRGRRRPLAAARPRLADRLGHSSRATAPPAAERGRAPSSPSTSPVIRPCAASCTSAGAGRRRSRPHARRRRQQGRAAARRGGRGLRRARRHRPALRSAVSPGAAARRAVAGRRRPRPRGAARRAHGAARARDRAASSSAATPTAAARPRCCWPRSRRSRARLLLQSYPLHPPGRPAALRTAHLPQLRIPTLFVHGATDAFAAPAELESARALIPGPTRVLSIEGGHDLGWGRSATATTCRQPSPTRSST